ncbi:MAG TPA: hypothetical protein VKT73_12350 [Xanthobacteraceae bacterium]|jgi:hypothetical protein|nr:hypothetical protein [Xanthobacteraceae bacterium]
MQRHPHILSASTNLLGICFVIIGGLKLTGQNPNSYSDEIAWVAAILLFTSTILSYLAIRNGDTRLWQIFVADWAFIGGMFTLLTSVLVAAIYL